MPCLGCYPTCRLPWMPCIHRTHLDHSQWPSPLVATDPCGTRHPANEEAQQGIAPNHDPPRVQPEGWEEVQLAAEWRRRSWWEDLSVMRSNLSTQCFDECLMVASSSRLPCFFGFSFAHSLNGMPYFLHLVFMHLAGIEVDGVDFSACVAHTNQRITIARLSLSVMACDSSHCEA